MKGIPVPNYTINKGTLAENMATAAIEYPFALAETMGGNVSTARVLAMGPLKILVENMAGRVEELYRERLVEGTRDKFSGSSRCKSYCRNIYRYAMICVF